MPASAIALAIAAVIGVALSPGYAAVVEHTFVVKDVVMRHLCVDTVTTLVNGQLPGPSIEVNEGDTVMVNVLNESPHGVTIHWHGVRQLMNCWADGVGMVTQCPIQPKSNFTYRFTITGQEGTLWWHAHNSYFRVTVYGPLIIRPKGGINAYPFPKPDKEVQIILGEWWKTNIVEVAKRVSIGSYSDSYDAFTINGKLGDTLSCSGNVEETYNLEVEFGKTYLLRIINAALYSGLFYKVAGHQFVVVAVDASYVKPYSTEVIVIAPGQTVDALIIANAPPGQYYMVAEVFQLRPVSPKAKQQQMTRGIVKYAAALPQLDGVIMMPQMPNVNDIHVAYNFHTSLRGLQQPAVPFHVDELLFITFGMALVCKNKVLPCKQNEQLVEASMNNISFQLPTKMSLLEAYYNGVEGIYTKDFPSKPPYFFNFTDKSLIVPNPREDGLALALRGTKVLTLKYNSTVEIVLQNTAIRGNQSHPIHIHGFNFFVLAQGYGNYNAEKALREYNLVDPQMRNTIAVPTNGWAVIRFVANNPGMWFMHCHFEVHVPMGMATAIEVENGPTPDTTLPPPPNDFPRCASPGLIKTGYKRNAQDEYE